MRSHVIYLDCGIAKFAADKTLGVEYGVACIHGNLILGGITNETFGLVESDIRGCGAVSLIVGNDLHTIILPDTYTRVSGAEVDTYGSSFDGHVISGYSKTVKYFNI